MMRRNAFSLVEIALALPIALVVLLTATAAFRTASKTAAVARQLAKENTAIIAGYEAAINEVDFWFCLDDPASSAGQPLRNAWKVRGLGSTTTAMASGSPGTDTYAGQPFVRLDLPSDYWNPAVWDARWWPRVGFESRSDGSGGREQQVGHVRHPNPDARWLPWVQDRCYWSLGLGGSFEYTVGSLPTNWLLPERPLSELGGGPLRGTNSYAQPVVLSAEGPLAQQWWAGLRSAGLFGDNASLRQSYPRRCVLYNRCSVWLAPRDGCTWNSALGAGSTLRYDIASSFSIHRLEADGDDNNNAVADTGLDAALPDSQGALYAGPPEVRVAPRGLPEVRVGVAHFSDRFANSMSVIDVRVFNQQAGTQRQIRFWSDGTSLRGARQQRMWSHWAAGTAPVIDAVRDPARTPTTALP